MKAIILAGGRGTRLRPLTDRCPKPMLPLLNQPVLAHLLDLLKRHHVTEVILTVQYLADQMQAYFGDGRDFGMRLYYALEERPLGTAGSIKNAQPFLNDAPFFVISGDAVTDINLSRVRQFHHLNNALGTLVLAPVDDPRSFGVVRINQLGRIMAFQEKPKSEIPISNTANTGIYMLDPAVLDLMVPGRSYDFAHDIFPKLLAQNARLFGYCTSDYWCDMGTWQGYRTAQADTLMGRVKLSEPAFPQPEPV